MKSLKFARLPKSVLRKIEDCKGKLANCQLHKKLTREKIDKAEVDKAHLARSAAGGHVYSASNLEDCCTFLNSQREKLAALQEVEDSLKAEIASLEKPAAEEVAARRRNQRLALKAQRDRARLTPAMKAAIARIAGLLKQYGKISQRLAELGDLIGLEMGRSRPWLTGESGRGLLANLSGFDPAGEDEKYVPHFLAELAGETYSFPDVPIPQLPELNQPSASQARYDALKSGRHPSPSHRRNDEVFRNHPFNARRIASL